MDIIKNYLESMFKNLPQTGKILKAKLELLQMMEDKFSELIKEGKSENEAIGTVISEFGNLQELAQDLGISEELSTENSQKEEKKDEISCEIKPDEKAENEEETTRFLSHEEIVNYFTVRNRRAFFVALGVLLCVTAPTGPIYSVALRIPDFLGVVFMFLAIAFGVFCFIFSSSWAHEMDYIFSEKFSLSNTEKEFLSNKRRSFNSKYSAILSLGIICFILSVVPPIVFGELGILVDLSGAFFLQIVGIGVFLCVLSGTVKSSFNKFFNLNGTFQDFKSFSSKNNTENNYSNSSVKKIMQVFWPTVTCVYLIWSFLTFNWHITWIIWPISGLLSGMISSLYGIKEEDLYDEK